MSWDVLLDELRQLVAQLALVSHAPISAYGRQTPDSGEDIGGKRPPGGDRERRPHDASEVEAWLACYQRRTPEYFARRLAACRSEYRLGLLVVEARETLEAWRRTPLPVGQEPEYGSAQWKRWIAESGEDAGTLATRFSVTRRYINMVRQQYRQAA